MNPQVGIIMGSQSDLPIMAEAAQFLEELGIAYELTVVSAHRTPQRMIDYAGSARERGIKVIVAGAGGAAHLAEILNQIDGTTVEQIIEDIEERDPELAEKIKQMMFVFEDIVLVDDKGLQKVLRSVESRELAVALKASTDDVKQKIFNNMSQRAVQILKEEMEVSGAVRMKDVTDAQQKITRIVQEMERKGELIISGRGGEEFIS